MGKDKRDTAVLITGTVAYARAYGSTSSVSSSSNSQGEAATDYSESSLEKDRDVGHHPRWSAFRKGAVLVTGILLSAGIAVSVGNASWATMNSNVSPSSVRGATGEVSPTCTPAGSC